MSDSFNFQSFLARWLVAVFLVLATYNPSGYSYLDWVLGPISENWLLKILVGIVIAILYATFLLATLRSLGRLGIAVWSLLFASLTWYAFNVGIIQRLTLGTIVMLVLFGIANIISVGLSWSYVRARLSGQADTNNVTLP